MSFGLSDVTAWLGLGPAPPAKKEPSGKKEPAYLILTEPSADGGKTTGTKKTINFSFNPKEFTLQRQAEWTADTTKKGEPQEFKGLKPTTVTLEMFLDASEGGDVLGAVNELFEAVDAHPKTLDTKPSPPFVAFGWGTTTYLQAAVIKTVSVKFTRFAPSGAPIRAVATITLDELVAGKARLNPTSGANGSHTSRLVSSSDTLASIAYDELGSPVLWRVIAEANGVRDAFRLKPGRRLVIPSLDTTPAET